MQEQTPIRRAPDAGPSPQDPGRAPGRRSLAAWSRRGLLGLALSLGASLSGTGSAGAAEVPPGELGTEVQLGPHEGIWTWIERFEGERLPPEAYEARDAAVDLALAERIVDRAPGRYDRPDDYYDDPAGALTGDALFLDEIDPADFDLPVVVNDAVIARLELLVGRHRRYFKRWLERKARYEDLIYAELDARGLPRDLIYLSMIESGFNTHAYSHAHAAGLWQFIPSTGRMYGLQVDWWVDERRDPVKATSASLEMLSRLHTMFDGDWFLAFAAYNTGPGRVRRALKRVKGDPESADYWTLVEQDLLHSETQGYVPKLIAAAIIGHDPERYGFVDLEPEAPLAQESVEVTGPVEVAVLAECAGLDEEAFRELNPSFRRYAIPEGTYRIHLPPQTSEAFVAALDAIPKEDRIRVVKHKVSAGESLSGIASRYGVPQGSLARVNGLSNPNLLRVGQWLVVPIKGQAPPGATTTAVVQTRRPAPAASGGAAASSGAGASDGPTTTHTVAAGESLSQIAARHGTSTATLQRLNDLSDPSRIRVGQRLKVPGGASGSDRTYVVRSGDALSRIAADHGVSLSALMSANDLSDPSRIRVGQRLVIPGAGGATAAPTTRYTVRSGDALSRIASDHGVSLSALMSANGLSDPSRIQVGQVLTIPGGGTASSWTRYTVQSGDALGVIARKHGVTVDQLRAWNDLAGSTIYPGQVLRIRSAE